MASKNSSPTPYLLGRLFRFALHYRFQIFIGWVSLGVLSVLLASLAALTKPLVNIATNSANAGERTWLYLKEFTAYLPDWIPVSQWGHDFLNALPPALYIGPHKTPILFCLFGTGVLCALAMGFTQFFAYYLTHKVSFRALTDIRSQLNKVLLNQNLGYYDRYRPGELMSKIQNDMETMGLALTFIFNQAPKALILVVGGFIMAFKQAPELTAAIIVLPIFIIPLKKIGKKVKRSSRYTLEMRAEMTDVMHQQFGGIREIMGFRLEKLRQKFFQNSNESVFRGIMSISRARALSRAIVEGGGYLVVFAIISAAVFISLKFGRTFGEFASFMATVSILIWNPLRILSRAYNNFQNSLPGVSSIISILDNPEPLSEPLTPQPFPQTIDRLTFDRVAYEYRNGQPILQDVSFEIKRGQVIAIVGHTGSGKSTLMDFIPRFRDPIRGEIRLNEINLRDLSLKDLRDHVSLVTQETYLFNTTIRDNLLMGNAQSSDDQLWDILKRVHLDDIIKEKPEGLDFVVGERGNRLSGGQRQRLAIARALLKNAPLLILDEATSAQDSISEKHIQKALEILMAGKTTFVIAHRLSTVQHADLVLVLKDGQLIEQGTHEELKALNGEYSSLHDTQLLN